MIRRSPLPLCLTLLLACAPTQDAQELQSQADADFDAAPDASPDLADSPDAAADLPGAPDAEADLAPGDDAALPPADMAPEEPPPEDMPPQEGERCGDLLVQATVGPEHRQEDGNFLLPELYPRNHALTDQCQVFDPSVTAGAESFVAFEAPEAGTYTFEAAGASQLSLWRSCALSEAPPECSWPVHYHDSRFSAPRTLTRALSEGERVWLGMDSVAGGLHRLTIHAPLALGQPCAADHNAYFNRECGEGLWCGATPDASALVCLETRAPAVERAFVAVEGQRLFAAAWGEDLDRNADALRVALLDARGEALPMPEGVPWLELWASDAGWEEARFTLKGAWAPYSPSQALPEGAVTARVWVRDQTGAVSEPFDVPVGARPQRARGERCDAARVEDLCSPGLSCLPRDGEHRCAALTLRAHTVADGELHLWASDPEGDPEGDAKLYLLDSPDARFPLAQVWASELRDPSGGWERKLRYVRAIYADWRSGPWWVAVGHSPEAFDAPILLEPSALPLGAALERCDGDRVADGCEAGLACLRPDPDAAPWRCEPVVAPVITRAEGFTNLETRDGVGMVLEGEDPNRDLRALLIQSLNQDGTSSGDTREEPLRYPGRHLRWDGDRFWVSWSRQWGRGSTFRVWALDGEGRASDPVDVTFREPPAEAAEGEPCDLFGQWSLCGEGLACDVLRDDPRGHSCHSLEAACPDDWAVTTIPTRRGERGAAISGELTQGAPLTLSCDGQAHDHDQAFRFVAPESAYYQVLLQGEPNAFPRLSLRERCALPVEGALACYEIYNDRQGRVATSLWLYEGQEIFLLTHWTPWEERPAPFTLSLSW